MRTFAWLKKKVWAFRLVTLTASLPPRPLTREVINRANETRAGAFASPLFSFSLLQTATHALDVLRQEFSTILWFWVGCGVFRERRMTVVKEFKSPWYTDSATYCLHYLSWAAIAVFVRVGLPPPNVAASRTQPPDPFLSLGEGIVLT